MKKLEAAFNHKPSVERIVIYAEMLGDVPADVLATAFEECLRHCAYFPTIAELRQQGTKPKRNGKADMGIDLPGYYDGLKDLR